MEKFQMNKDLEGIINQYAGNLETVEDSLQRDPKQPYASNVYSDQSATEVSGSPEKVRQHALAHMSLFHNFFNEYGLGKEQWQNFLETYYHPLKTEAKDGVIKRVLPYLSKEDRELLQKNPYFLIILAMEDLAKTIKKEDLSEKELGELVAKHFVDVVGEKEGKPIGKPNPYAIAAIQDYKANREGVRSLTEMRLRVYDLQKKKTPRDELDKVMNYSEKDAAENYSIGNYAKATSAYQFSKAQQESEKQEAEKQQAKKAA